MARLDLPPDFLLLGASESMTEGMPRQTRFICSGDLALLFEKIVGPRELSHLRLHCGGGREEGGTPRGADSLQSLESPGLSDWL